MCTPEDAKFVILKLTPTLDISKTVFCKDEAEVKIEKNKVVDNPKVVNKGNYIVLPIIENFEV
jgi:hypothetical protein